MRYQAPEHTSSVFAPSGELRADKAGVIKLADDAPDSDHAALRRAGCAPISDEAHRAPKVKPLRPPKAPKGPKKTPAPKPPEAAPGA